MGTAQRSFRASRTRVLLALLVAGVISLIGCGEKQESAPTQAGAQSPAAAPEGAAVQPVPAQVVTQASWAPDALEELLAPIALYPDSLLSQVLAASVNAQEVLDGGNWLLQNENLKGNELDAAAEKAGFGPAMRALVQFPTVVDMMCQQIDWTRQLGSAFTSDQKAVLDAVQRLRAQAANVGNLKSTPQQTVETRKENDKVIVEVKPADPTVVYVPQYNPEVVYTQSPPTTASSEDTVSTGTAVAAGLLAFGIGVLVGNAFHDDCYPHWSTGSVYYGPRPFYPPAYVYRPVYGPAFRPAYGYVSPPGYRYNYNNINVHNDININVNNDNYYNRFKNNQNLNVGRAQSPLGGSQRVAQQPVSGAPRNENWKGQSTYAGARDQATGERVGQTGGVRNERLDQAANRPGAEPTARVAQNDRAQHVDRGYGESTRQTQRDSGSVGDAVSSAREAGGTVRDTSASRDHAFADTQSVGGGSGGGSFDRAASARGHASSSARQTAARAGGGGRRR